MDSLNEWSDFGLSRSPSAVSREEKKNVKKSKKTDRIDSSAKKKKKSKRRSSKETDADIGLFTDGGLFSKAMAQAHREDEFALSEAFEDMREDQEFLNAFESVNFDAFQADYQTALAPLEQAPVVRSSAPDLNEDDDEWIVDNHSKGAAMKEYVRRLSVQSSKADSTGEEGQVIVQPRATRKPNSKAGFSDDTPQVRNAGSSHGSQTSRKVASVDMSNFLSTAREPSTILCHDESTIRSELTGLTGAFSTMQKDVDGDEDSDEDGDDDSDEDDDESSTDEEDDDLAYPISNPATLKTLPMQSEQMQRMKPSVTVRFGYVSVRSYQRIIGDNPSCKTGAPISIGWSVESETRHATPDAHDLARGRAVRTSSELVLSREVRHDMLKTLGYSDREIAHVVRVVLKDKNKRRTTVNNLPAEAVEEKLESVTNGVKRMFFSKRR